MTPNHRSAAPPAGPEVPSVAAAAGALATAVDELAAADRAICRAVLALCQTVGTGICESVEGLPPDLLLANLCRLIRSDRSTVLTAADVLRSMPEVCRLWRAGTLTWGQVRNLCLKAAKLSTGQRATLDRRLAGTDDLDAYGPDGVLDAVDRAVWDLRDAARAERAEERKARGDFIAVQSDLDGGVRFHGEYAGVAAATFMHAIHDAAPPIDTTTTRGRRLAVGLERVCGGWLAGGKGRSAKPLVDVLVDLTQVTVNAAGTVDLHIDGPLTTLTARTVEALTADADLRVTLFHGKRPLATSKLREAPAIPTAVRRAVRLRDRGDRMPGSRAPAVLTDTHHVRERSRGGDHHPDNLVSLRSRSHHLLHDRGWTNRLDPTTGIFTIERHGRRYRSLPKGTPLAPDPGDAPDPPSDPPQH